LTRPRLTEIDNQPSSSSKLSSPFFSFFAFFPFFCSSPPNFASGPTATALRFVDLASVVAIEDGLDDEGCLEEDDDDDEVLVVVVVAEEGFDSDEDIGGRPLAVVQQSKHVKKTIST
jgi:hypothetical protein